MESNDKEINIPYKSTILHQSKDILKKIYRQTFNLKWSNIILLTIIHILSVLSIIYLKDCQIKFYTCIFAPFLGLFSGMGMSIGAHRLWAHRSFKATFSLKLILAIFQAMTMNGSAFSYARDHRTHHKYSDTDKDPKNPSRGLFYSHIGWWMVKKSDTVKMAGQKLDFTDLKEDKICWYQHKFYILLFIIFGVIIPTIIPYYCWNEDFLIAFYICVVLRIVIVLHHLFTVNSIAHFFGHKPYNFRIRPTENRIVIYLSLGEGNHNYHHIFPYDYSSSEKKAWEFFNPSTLLIDMFWLFGMAYDCKKASPNIIEGTIKRCGIPAYFDSPRGLCFRIINGIFDWFLGLIFSMWIIWPLLIYKYITGKPNITF